MGLIDRYYDESLIDEEKQEKLFPVKINALPYSSTLRIKIEGKKKEHYYFFKDKENKYKFTRIFYKKVNDIWEEKELPAKISKQSLNSLIAALESNINLLNLSLKNNEKYLRKLIDTGASQRAINNFRDNSYIKTKLEGMKALLNYLDPAFEL